MNSSIPGLKAQTLDWLLEEANPSVRYFTLKDILEKPEDDADVQAAKQAIMQSGAVAKILQKQCEPEYRESFKKFYRDKYKGIVWQAIVLAELGATPNELIKEQCEYLFSCSQEKESGGFSYDHSVKEGCGLKSGVVPCLTGNLVFALIRLGYLGDPRLQKAIDWITTYQRFDDGDGNPPKEWPYERYEMCWGSHTCHMGAVKALKGLCAIPEGLRTAEVKKKTGQGIEYILKHHIHKKSHNLSEVSRPGWLRSGFPLMYQTDALEILDILAALGVKDSRMDEAVDIVLSRQDGNGRWKLENTFNDRLLVPIEKKGALSKWVTLRALRVLKRINS